MLQFNPELLLSKSKKPINVKEEISNDIFIFTYKDKTNQINYEQYKVNIDGVEESKIEEYVKKYFSDMLNKFNSNLRPYESKRTLLNVYRIQTSTNLIKF